MKMRYHYPAFVDVAEETPRDMEYRDQADFLEHPNIKRLMGEPIFDHWEIANHVDLPDLLMLLTKNGEWWVIGYLSEQHGLTFPEWKGSKP